MTPAEADARAALEKAAFLDAHKDTPRAERIELINRAMEYRTAHGREMGSMASARICSLFFVPRWYQRRADSPSWAEVADAASEETVDEAFEYASLYIDRMLANPMTTCPCCGSIVPDKKAAAA